MSEIRVVATGKFSSNFEASILDEVNLRYSRAKRATMMELYERLREEVIHNIQQNSDDSQYPFDPTTSRLVASMRLNLRTNSISIGGRFLAPYAALYNQPVGTSTSVWANTGRLKFYWHRINKPMKIKMVNKPGTAFFSRAWSEVKEDIPAIFAEAQAQVNAERNARFH